MEDKKKVAIASAFLAGGMMFYFMRDVFEEILKEDEIKPVRKEEIEKKEDYLISVDAEKLKEILGDNYPGDDMWKIYYLLPVDLIKRWRRGIKMFGSKTGLDMQFVYVDSAVLLKTYKHEYLQKAFILYEKGVVRFATFEDAYRKFLEEHPELTT